MNLRVLVILALLSAGCLGQSNETPPGPGTTSDTPRESNPGNQNATIPLEPSANGTVTEVPAYLVVDSCSMWQGYYQLPSALVPGEVPPGWEQEDDGLAVIGITGYHCDKLALGTFERGPIDFLFEWHTKGVRPQGCQSQVGAGHYSLIQAIFSDAEVADFMQSTYDMPAYFGDFTQTVSTLPAGETRTWTWSVSGGADSTITIAVDGTESATEVVDWYWWPRGDGLVRLEMHKELASSQFTDRVGQGRFAEPMAMAAIADGNFAGRADYYPSAMLTNAFAFHADTQCTPP